MIKSILFLLFTVVCFSQQNPLELKIDHIETTALEDGDRKFTIHYHILNTAEKPVAFILDTRQIIPINSGSMRYNPYYKIYENEEVFNAWGVLVGENRKRLQIDPVYAAKMRDSLVKSYLVKTKEQMLSENKQELLENIKRLQPKQRMNFDAVLIWSKQRYYKQDDIEYYLQENEPHFFELQINLMTKALLNDFPEDEKNQFLSDNDLLVGWYTSNRMEIDFGE